jgi:hypothetical protein
VRDEKLALFAGLGLDGHMNEIPELGQFYIAGFSCEHPRLRPNSQTLLLLLLRSDFPLRRDCLILPRLLLHFRGMRTLVRNVVP